jgi:hypothetical protein
MAPAPHAADQHKAADLFNHAWALLDTTHRTPAQDDEMVHAAHASAWYWLKSGSSQHQFRAHWQLARIYAALGRAEPALHHAERCRHLCTDRVLTTFEHACFFEVQARAYASAHRRLEAQITLQRARLVAASLTDPEEIALMDADMTETERLF